MKLVVSLHCRGSDVGRLTYYREKVEQVLPSFVSDLLRVEAKWRSHAGLSIDKDEMSGLSEERYGRNIDFRLAWAPSDEERVEGS